MSYLNINFSTLEEAWGTNFEKSKKNKEHNVCNLYNKRNSNTYKPYKTLVDSKHIKPIYEDDSYIKYHGYNDGRPYSRKSNKLSKYKLQFPYKKPIYATREEEENEGLDENIQSEEEYEESFLPIKPNVKVNQYGNYNASKTKKLPPLMRTDFSYIDEDHSSPMLMMKRPIVMEEDTVASSQELRKRVHPSFKKSNTLSNQLVQPDDDFVGTPIQTTQFAPTTILDTDDSDDEFEAYLKPMRNIRYEEEEEDNENQYMKVLQTVNEEMLQRTDKHRRTKSRTFREEEEEEEEDYKLPIYKKRRNERIYLDLSLYTISGIILIFIMEQFIQIGMKIKTPI
ncbi:hypothetical protein QKU58_gp056 [Pyramimonas orientalis virus]|uniref:Uncharacterized protein n=1 Tax=Pyramimonas orientalis virus 01B TaxID=3134525 RepID=A0A7M3UNL0_9VIRU|nr:hypothetical protein QKU58_gp056 [Pyramimonas orientalis virus]QOI90275.1 hypothetical protein HWQ62_00138 [Pyramimonas orientalis virus]